MNYMDTWSIREIKNPGQQRSALRPVPRRPAFEALRPAAVPKKPLYKLTYIESTRRVAWSTSKLCVGKGFQK